LQIVHTSENATIGVVGNVVIWKWHQMPSDFVLSSMRREVASLSRTYPEGTGAIHVIAMPDRQFPDDVQRKKLVALRRDCEYSIRASALLFEGDGIRSAVIRSLATAVMMASGNKRPQLVFGDASAATSWLRGQLGHGAPDATALATGLASIKAALPPAS
jgi:hypothetical protein